MIVDQDRAPYVEAVRAHSTEEWWRGMVPGHGAGGQWFPLLSDYVGGSLLALDVPPLLDGIDTGPSPTPLEQSLELAAAAWGAQRTWFLTGGASQANRIAVLACRGLGPSLVVQRSVHSSVIDGLIVSGARASFVTPSVDTRCGIAHGIGAQALGHALARTTDAAAAFIVSPSYFGAVTDVPALADVAHRAGVPLVVDEAWGAHFGFHPRLPANALQCGADLVISSTHKLGGSLTQSAMLHLRQGPFSALLEPLVDRAYRLTQSTSTSSILLASLDLARRQLATGRSQIEVSIDLADEVRQMIAARGRFRLVSDTFVRFPTVVTSDPLRIAVDTRAGGLSGRLAQLLLRADHRVLVEVATDGAIVAVVGAGAQPDVGRFVGALHALPSGGDARAARDAMTGPPLPPPGPAVLTPREAFFAASEAVASDNAVGRVSADSLAAYPPGIPSLLPG
jgi:arginine decarboxylase